MGKVIKIHASDADRWAACPGSVGLERDKGVRTSSPYAEAGEAAHALAEHALQNDIDKTDNPAVNSYLTFIRMLEMGQTVAERGIDNTFKCSLGVVGVADMTCRVDYYAVLENVEGDGYTLIVADYKNGSQSVSAYGNRQLMIYARAVAENLLGGWYNRITHVSIYIIQPNSPQSDGKITSEQTMTFKEFFELFKSRVSEPLAALVEPGANEKFHFGDHCRFCSAAHVCPEVRKAANSADSVSEDIASATHLLSAETAISQSLKLSKEIVKKALEQGSEVPGWKLVFTNVKCRWTDPDTVVAYFEKVGASDAIKKTPIGITDASKHAKPEVRQAAKDMVIKPDAPITIAPSSDCRPAIEVGKENQSKADEKFGGTLS